MFNSNLNAEEFNISALEFSVDQKNNIVIGEGDVEVTDFEGQLIKANKVTYKKSKEFLLAEGSVEITDIEGNVFRSNKATYDKIEEIIIPSGYTGTSQTKGRNEELKPRNSGVLV